MFRAVRKINLASLYAKPAARLNQRSRLLKCLNPLKIRVEFTLADLSRTLICRVPFGLCVWDFDLGFPMQGMAASVRMTYRLSGTGFLK